ncbi:MAG: hypothetical protein AAFX40_06915 [Cyanobacteria bacterium J06639_1]
MSSLRQRMTPSLLPLLALSSGLGLSLSATSAIANPTELLSPSPTLIAQASIDFAEIRALGTAKNYARQAGEAANGGLSAYRAEDAMHGFAGEAPYRDGGDRWIFTFKGRSPEASTYTLESEVEVMKDSLTTTVLYNGPIRSSEQPSTTPVTTQSLPLSNAESPNDSGFTELPVEPVELPIETTELPVETVERPIEFTPPSEENFASETSLAALARVDRFNTAKNYARQAAEQTNGGLGVYRAEDVMHGPAADTPHRETDTAWIFTFKGRSPGESIYSVESEISVDKTTLVTTMLYNGSPR